MFATAMIMTHAAAVHGLEITPEGVDPSCVAPPCLGKNGTGIKRDRRPTTAALNHLVSRFGEHAGLTMDKRLNRIIAMMLARVERPFQIVKRQSGYVKT